MKIAEVRTSVVALPADEPLANAPNMPGGSRDVVALELRTDDGIEGIGVTYLGAALTRSLRHAVQCLGELLIGEDASDIDACVAGLHARAGGSGPAGIFSLAIAAVEIALWDIAGKAAGAPLWKLVGASGAPVPCYASGALMRELTLDTALAAAGRLKEAGFTAMKFQLALPGETGFEIEIERARLIREAVGPDVALMCDINQRWKLYEALKFGRALEEFELGWLEDPTAHDDVNGLAELCETLQTPVAAGEYLYTLGSFRQALEARAIDIVMIDPFRAGGISNWLKIAALADLFGKRVVSHLAPEVQLHLVGAIPNGWTVEYMPWFNALYEDVVWPVNGMLSMPQAPGLGLRFDRKVLDRYTVEHARS